MTVLLQDDSKLRKFVIRYILIGFGLFLFMYVNQQNLISRPVNSFTAHSVKVLAEIFHYPANVDQVTYTRERGNDNIRVPTTLLKVGRYKARVILECSAVHAGILLVTFILAYPAPGSRKIYGVLFLVPCLVAFNSIRIFILMLLGHYFGQSSAVFHIFHLYVMQVVIIALVLVLALVWLRRCELGKADYPVWFFLKFLAVSAGLMVLWFGLRNRWGSDSEILERFVFPFLTFGALVLSGSRFTLRQSRRDIFMGFGVMLGFLVLGQAARFKYEHFHSASAELLFVMMNSALKYILPFGLFFFLMRKSLFVRTDPAGKQVFGCPLCDKQDIRKRRAHAQAKHGRELLQGEERLLNAIRMTERLDASFTGRDGEGSR